MPRAGWLGTVLFVLTLGIDLSAKDSQTAACYLDWRVGAGTDRGAPPYVGVGDDALLGMMEKADKVGIDAPFGWPDTFREMVNTWSEEGAWEGDMPRSSLRYRLTDQFQISQGRTPLSVSSDRIASTAMRCADLLAQHYLARDEALDRVTGHVVEVYPAAALVDGGSTSRATRTAWQPTSARRCSNGSSTRRGWSCRR